MLNKERQFVDNDKAINHYKGISSIGDRLIAEY